MKFSNLWITALVETVVVETRWILHVSSVIIGDSIIVRIKNKTKTTVLSELPFYFKLNSIKELKLQLCEPYIIYLRGLLIPDLLTQNHRSREVTNKWKWGLHNTFRKLGNYPMLIILLNVAFVVFI